MKGRKHKEPRKPFRFEGAVTGLKSRFIRVEPLSAPLSSSKLGRVTVTLTRVELKPKRRK